MRGDSKARPRRGERERGGGDYLEAQCTEGVASSINANMIPTNEMGGKIERD